MKPVLAGQAENLFAQGDLGKPDWAIGVSLGSEHFVVDFYADRHTVSPVKDIVVLEALAIKQIVEDPAVVHHLDLISTVPRVR